MPVLIYDAFVVLVEWWRSYGGRAIELQRFARRVVSLCASSSGCERNWSAFEFVSFPSSPLLAVLTNISIQQAFYSSFCYIVFLVL